MIFQFKETESGIDYLARRVENEFEHSKKGGDANPAALLRNLAEIKTEFTSLTKEVQAIQQAQKETVDYIKDQLTTTWGLLQNLQQNSNIPNDGEKPPELAKLEEILGIKLPDLQAVPEDGRVSNPEGGDTGQRDSTFTVEEEDQSNSSPCSCPDVSPSSKRSHSDEFIELTQAELDSVSPSIRGRLKLMEVNMVYRILWRHFKEEKNRYLTLYVYNSCMQLS
ncbi:hypothetical protein FSP39_014407 [Pinctada imbricata]|uniref:Protein FAM33A n=1 Tax=Pinctada imbricata TaxID=66713 RepID=A0AA88XFS1_PINIB|nr:hypothetical protein FSP39_014407 [Pinctada imbricata]